MGMRIHKEVTLFNNVSDNKKVEEILILVWNRHELNIDLRKRAQFIFFFEFSKSSKNQLLTKLYNSKYWRKKTFSHIHLLSKKAITEPYKYSKVERRSVSNATVTIQTLDSSNIRQTPESTNSCQVKKHYKPSTGTKLESSNPGHAQNLDV